MTFGNITKTVAAIKALNFSVSLWVHPYINVACAEYSEVGQLNGIFLLYKATLGFAVSGIIVIMFLQKGYFSLRPLREKRARWTRNPLVEGFHQQHSSD